LPDVELSRVGNIIDDAAERIKRRDIVPTLAA
jgi:hypothetical protein